MFPSGEPTATCAQERQPGVLSEHLVGLPGWETEWALWRWAGLRGAGFAAAGVLGLAAEGGARAADELLEAEAEAELAWERALDAVNVALEALPWVDGRCEDPRVRPLVKAMRLLRKGKQPPPSLLEEGTAQAEAAADFRRASARADDAHAEFASRFEASLEEVARALRAAAADGRFREAVTWQNRRALRTGIDSVLRDAASNRLGRNERLVASYLQRYCVKNDSIGFFGPVGWAHIRPDTHSVSVRPGPTLLASREVYFECWAIDALCQRLSRDASLRPWMRPRRLPSVRLEGGTLHLPFKPPARLTRQQSLVLAACDGETTAREIARRLLAAPDGALGSEEHVYSELGRLAELHLIVWQLEVGDGPRPERRLRELLEGVEDAEAREKALELLGKMEAARAEVARAAGDAERLGRAMEELEATFESETGVGATRKEGQMYAGRTLVYEDCRRDAEVGIGADVLEGLSGALALLLESARWLAWRVGEEYRRALRDIYLSLARQCGSNVLDIEPLWLQAEPLLVGSETRLLDGVVGTFQQRWSEIFSLSADARAAQYDGEGLRGRVADAFAAPRTGWSAARYHSPDVMIAAEGVDVIRRGDYLFVLGELHVATNTLSSSTFVSQHPSPEDLYRAVAADLPRPRVVPVLPKNAHVPKRATPVLNSPGDFLLEFGDGAPGVPPARSLPASALVVEASGPDLFVRTRDGRLRFDIIEFFGSVLSGTIIDKFKLFGPREHTPRVSIDRLVVQRESWAATASEAAFAFERSEADRFLEARRFARARGIPRHAFFKVPAEVKPVYVDFDSPAYVELLAKLVRRSAETEGEGARVEFTEMLPGVGQWWLPDAEGGRYTSEFRFVALDRHAA